MYAPTRVLIFGKTYPELSAKYTETVCTGGFREDGTPIRLYPVPLRYLEGKQQYKLYEWITVPIRKSTSDPRPESYKIVPDKIERGELVDTDHGSWRRRREIEPPRDCRRLQSLRGWSHVTSLTVFPRSA
jgi:hypothetical protein